MNKNDETANETTPANPACGCFEVALPGIRRGRHTAQCLRRGRDKMNAEEIAADVLRELEEDRAEARAELLSDATKKLDEVLPTLLGALDASKELRPKLPWKEVAAELRSLFADDLAPFGELLRDAATRLTWESSKMTADTIKRLFEETQLPMDVCVQIVLNARHDLGKAINSINASSSSSSSSKSDKK